MTLHIVSRADIGVPDPGNRPRLRSGLNLLLVHHTGAPAEPAASSSLAWATGIARYGRSVGKPWEYNFMIGRDGVIYEQAGAFMGAHCLRMNALSIGVLLQAAVGSPESLTAECMSAFRGLRLSLYSGPLACTAEVWPHYHFRSTACPGGFAEAPGAAWDSPTREGRLGAVEAGLLAPWTATDPS